MICLWFNTKIMTANAHMIMHKGVSFLVNNFTHNSCIIVSTFLWRVFRLVPLISWNHQPYIWNNFIVIYLMSYQGARTYATHLHTLLWFLLIKGFIALLLTTMRDHVDFFTKKYCCESAIYLLSCFSLEFIIIIYRAFCAFVHVKDVVYGINYIYNIILKLEITRLLYPELIRYD